MLVLLSSTANGNVARTHEGRHRKKYPFCGRERNPLGGGSYIIVRVKGAPNQLLAALDVFAGPTGH